MSVPRHALPQHAWHPRSYRENRYVYPVLSRRAKGISVGVNLNPNKICNFDCLYCQVDRRSDAEVDFVDTDRLIEELDRTIDWVLTGELFDDEKFAAVPAELRRLNDIAFSGDGEPTSFRNFASVVSQVVELQRRKRLLAVKLIVLTNASLLDRPAVRQALDTLMSHHGEIWAKLDAGTPGILSTGQPNADPLSRGSWTIYSRHRGAGRWSFKPCSCRSIVNRRPSPKSMPTSNELQISSTQAARSNWCSCIP